MGTAPPGKAMKASVWSSSRITDKEIGLDCSQLSKAVAKTTKPHTMMQRLGLTSVLRQMFSDAPNPDEWNIHTALGSLWVNKLVPIDAFIRFKQGPLMDSENAFLTLSCGPYKVVAMELNRKTTHMHDRTQECFTLRSYGEWPMKEFPLTSIHEVEVATTTPVIPANMCLGWAQSSDWMKLEKFVAEFTIHLIPAVLLSQLCRCLKIPGHSGLNHKSRCELFLRHLDYSDDYIQEIMLLLPHTVQRARKTEAGCHGCLSFLWLCARVSVAFTRLGRMIEHLTHSPFQVNGKSMGCHCNRVLLF